MASKKTEETIEQIAGRIQPLVQGNSKLGRNLIWHFSMLAILTCPGRSALCENICYALGFLFKQSEKWAKARMLMRNQLDFVFRVSVQIRANFVKVLRIHVAGDFDSVEYIRKWIEIAQKHKTVTFYGYTRSWQVSELIPASHFMPLVDDDVFIRPFRKDHPEFGMLNDPGVSSVSLRLGVDITKCYAMGDLATPPPQRDQNGCYDWHGLPGDWGYPMSLDGNLYRANDIYPLITATQADNPNLLEAALSGSPIVRPRICCYDEPRLVNIPHNRVQNVYSNRSMGQEVNELNARFNEGHRLAYEHFEKIRCSTVHAELPLRYLPENYA